MTINLPLGAIQQRVDTFASDLGSTASTSQTARKNFEFVYWAMGQEVNEIQTLLNELMFTSKASQQYLMQLNAQKAAEQAAGISNPDLDTDIADFQNIVALAEQMINRNFIKKLKIYNAINQLKPVVENQDAMNMVLMQKMYLNNSVNAYVKSMNDAANDAAKQIAIDGFFAGIFISTWSPSVPDIALPGGVVLFKDGVSPSDVNQQGVGDCWLLSVLAGIARNDPGAIQRAIRILAPGVYEVTLTGKDGKPRKIIVTEAEINAQGSWNHASNANENWVAAFEIAFAKSKGVLDADPTGLMDPDTRPGVDNGTLGDGGSLDRGQEIYSSITGRPATVEWLTNMNADQRYNFISNELAQGHMVRADIVLEATGRAIPNPKPAWLIDGHAYTVVGASNGTITLRNPWGISAPGSDGSGNFTITKEEFAFYTYDGVLVGH